MLKAGSNNAILNILTLIFQQNDNFRGITQGLWASYNNIGGGWGGGVRMGVWLLFSNRVWLYSIDYVYANLNWICRSRLCSSQQPDAQVYLLELNYVALLWVAFSQFAWVIPLSFLTHTIISPPLSLSLSLSLCLSSFLPSFFLYLPFTIFPFQANRLKTLLSIYFMYFRFAQFILIIKTWRERVCWYAFAISSFANNFNFYVLMLKTKFYMTTKKCYACSLNAPNLDTGCCQKHNFPPIIFKTLPPIPRQSWTSICRQKVQRAKWSWLYTCTAVTTWTICCSEYKASNG